MSVRIYGRGSGNGSHAIVTRGFVRAIEAAGLLEGLVPLETPEEEDNQYPGALARHAVHTGDLKWVLQIECNARHEFKWAVVAPNSNHLPVRIVQALHRLKAVCLAPSPWAADQIGRYDLPTMVVPHGVQGFDTVERSGAHEAYASGRFQVLHLSSSAGQRKGTYELLLGWDEAIRSGGIPVSSVLVCVLDHDALQSLKHRLVDAEVIVPGSVKLLPRADFTSGQLASLLANAHVLCQPSRAEAFGLIPLEALACGVPVIATVCTGHSYLHDMPGVMPVHHEENSPIDDGPGAVAPAVAFDEIARALGAAWRFWKNLNAQAQANAAALREHWSWENQLAGLVARLKRL